MKQFFGKLRFVHRRLWSQDGLYRLALLFGPAALFGGVLAAVVWEGGLLLKDTTSHSPPWAVVQQSSQSWNTDGGQPQTVSPTLPLPSVGADGALSGYETGGEGFIKPIEVSPTMDVNVKPNVLSAFSIEGTSIDMAQIIANGPKGALFIGTGSGFLAVRTAGVYALSIRFERPVGPLADCLVRMGFSSQRIVSNLNVAVVSDFSKTYDAARFDLQPGLYSLAWGLGCWHDHEVIGPGRITLMVAHPGEQALLSARPDDIVRAERIKP